MTEPRQIAVVRSYDDLLSVMRQRVAELGINYQILDDVTCFTDSYSTKVLGRGAITRTHDTAGKLKRSTQRGLSPQAFDAFVGSLGFDLVAVENPERTEKLRAWLVKRETRPKLAARMLPIGSMPPATWLITRKKSPWLNKLRTEKMSPERRSESARTAALARWRKPKITEINDKMPSNASNRTQQKCGALPIIKSSGITRGANKKTSPPQQSARSEARTVRRR